MRNNPNSSLLKDVQASFFLVNPTTYNMEYSRELYYSSLEFFNGFQVKANLSCLLKVLGLPSDLIYYFLTINNYPKTTSSSTVDSLMKSQYRPMRRGITNMIRLHGTGAVAMPIEIRLQVLASSKDVIHS
jgi:hypothetical protein